MLLSGNFTAVRHRGGLLSATIITTTRDSISSRPSPPPPHARADLHLATLIHSPSSLSLLLVKPSVPHHRHHTVITLVPRIFHHSRKALIRLAVHHLWPWLHPPGQLTPAEATSKQRPIIIPARPGGHLSSSLLGLRQPLLWLSL